MYGYVFACHKVDEQVIYPIEAALRKSPSSYELIKSGKKNTEYKNKVTA